VQQAGFDYACTNFGGIVAHTTDSFQLPRLFVPDCDGAQFAQRLEKQFQAVGS
jgi:hypothetical protein